jgi:hypothetical protein
VRGFYVVFADQRPKAPPNSLTNAFGLTHRLGLHALLHGRSQSISAAGESSPSHLSDGIRNYGSSINSQVK